jgi:hypothetical protein
VFLVNRHLQSPRLDWLADGRLLAARFFGRARHSVRVDLHRAQFGLQNYAFLQPMPGQVSLQFLAVLQRIRPGQNEFENKNKNNVDTLSLIQVKTASSS